MKVSVALINDCVILDITLDADAVDGQKELLAVIDTLKALGKWKEARINLHATTCDNLKYCVSRAKGI